MSLFNSDVDFLRFLKERHLNERVELKNGYDIEIRFKNFYSVNGKPSIIIHDSTLSIVQREIMSGKIPLPIPCCNILGFQMNESEKKYCNCQYGKSKEIEATFASKIPKLDNRTNTIHLDCNELRRFLNLSQSQTLLLTNSNTQPILCISLNIPSGYSLSDDTTGKVFKINESYLVIIDVIEYNDVKFCECKIPAIDSSYLDILVERSTSRPFFGKESKELVFAINEYEYIFVISPLVLLQYTLLNNLVLSNYSFKMSTYNDKKIIYVHKCQISCF